MLSVEHSQKRDWVGELRHGWFEGRDASSQVGADRHVLILRHVGHLALQLGDLGLLAAGGDRHGGCVVDTTTMWRRKCEREWKTAEMNSV